MTAEHPVNPKAVTWLEQRAIDPETAFRMGFYTGSLETTGVDDDGKDVKEVLPSASGNIICFPYIDGGREVNCKYRMTDRKTGEKRYWQRAGARKTFYNADVMDDPLLERGEVALVITEGEPDAIAAVQSGHRWSVSVPDGAPAARDQAGNVIPMKRDEEIDPNDDPKFEYLRNNWDRLAKVKRIILATDGDEPGIRLRDELARRLYRARCYFITYPQDRCVKGKGGEMRACKDLNEVADYFGDKRVLEIIQAAKPYPISGLYKLSDFEDRGQIVTYSTGFPLLDDLFRYYPGAFCVASGLPMHGKSALFNHIAFNMALHHKWKVGICSFEAPIKPVILNHLRHHHIMRPREQWTQEMIDEADEFIEEHFCFISQGNGARFSDDTRCTVPWLLDKAYEAVTRHGIKHLLIDPWNEIEHERKANQMRDEYLNDAIRDVKRFCAETSVCTTVVAHPTKSSADAVKAGDAISLYDISDGAAWANKAEIGVIVFRPSMADNQTKIFTRKVKFDGTGKVGEVLLEYDRHTKGFIDDTLMRQSQYLAY